MATQSEIAARLRAARGYSGMDQKDLAGRLGFSTETLSRIENGRQRASAERRRKIAVICGVPEAFIEVGFAPFDEPLTDLEREVRSLRDSQRELAAAVERLSSQQKTAEQIQAEIEASIAERLARARQSSAESGAETPDQQCQDPPPPPH